MAPPRGRSWLAAAIALLRFGAAGPTEAEPTRGPLQVDAINPRYFVDQQGEVVYLTGSHTWQNFKDRSTIDPPPPFDFAAYLDFLVAHNHNFIRLFTWEQPKSRNNNPDNLKRYFFPFPWQRSGPGLASDGKPRFDLDQLDQAYFDRLRSRVIAARDRGIYVAVMLFGGWDLANAYNPTDGGFPFGSGNNVNAIASTGTESQSLVHPAVTSVQEAYVRKVIDTVTDLDNVLYEIANETGSYGVQWQYHMIAVVKQYEATKLTQHPVGMTVPYPGSDDDVLASDADWISPVSRFLASNGSKVVLNDTDHSYYWVNLKSDGLAAQREWAWKTLALGASPLFMDPYLEEWAGRNDPNGTAVDPYWETLRNALGDARRYAERVDLRYAVPSGALCSTGHCLANPGFEYLVFQPNSGAFSITMAAGRYAYEWFDPAARTVAATGTIDVASGARAFTPPFAGQAVLLLPEPGSSLSLAAAVALLSFAACASGAVRRRRSA